MSKFGNYIEENPIDTLSLRWPPAFGDLEGNPSPSIRQFETGANRDADHNKLDFEGFISPLVIQRYAEYMHSNRFLKNGTIRDSDNWQKGIPLTVYMKSAWRHFFDFWKEHRGIPTKEGLELALCGLLFNTMGYLHEHLKTKQNVQS